MKTDLAAGASQVEHHLGNVEDGQLSWISYVNRVMDGLCIVLLPEQERAPVGPLLHALTGGVYRRIDGCPPGGSHPLWASRLKGLWLLEASRRWTEEHRDSSRLQGSRRARREEVVRALKERLELPAFLA